MNIDEVMDKIRKAVRLANRTSEEGERQTALRLARGLAEKHGVSFEDIEETQSDTDKCVHETEDEYHACNGVELGHVCYILQQHFGVILMLHTVRGKTWKAKKSWFGSHLNIDIAKHVYHILMRESRRAYREASRATVDTSALEEKRNKLLNEMEGWGMLFSEACRAVAKLVPSNVNRKSFMRGFFFAIDKKLTEHPLRNDLDADRNAAMKKLDEYKNNNRVKEQKARRDRNPDQSALNAGFAAGSKMNLARPCKGEASSPLAIAV